MPTGQLDHRLQVYSAKPPTPPHSETITNAKACHVGADRHNYTAELMPHDAAVIDPSP